MFINYSQDLLMEFCGLYSQMQFYCVNFQVYDTPLYNNFRGICLYCTVTCNCMYQPHQQHVCLLQHKSNISEPPLSLAGQLYGVECAGSAERSASW